MAQEQELHHHDNMNMKQRKEWSVQGHTGVDHPMEITLMCASAPIGVFLYLELYMTFFLSEKKNDLKTNKKNSKKWLLVVLEMTTMWMPMFICQTAFFHPYGTTILLSEAVLAFMLHLNRKRQPASKQYEQSTTSPPPGQNNPTPRLAYVTMARACVYFWTLSSILAVDFPAIFPRKLVKTEVDGWGYMDLGAASTIISSAFVSRYARQHLKPCKDNNQRMLANRTGMQDQSDKNIIKQSSTLVYIIQKLLPLLVLGLVRLVGNKSVDYQEHDSEYGNQWNFFFTLAVVVLCSSLLPRNCSRGITLLVPIVLLTGYQMCLSWGNLQGWIEDATRECPCPPPSNTSISDDDDDMLSFNKPFFCRFISSSLSSGLILPLWGWRLMHSLCHFVTANREGVLGCVGYVVLSRLAEEVARFSLWFDTTTIMAAKGGGGDETMASNQMGPKDSNEPLSGKSAQKLHEKTHNATTASPFPQVPNQSEINVPLQRGQRLLLCCIVQWSVLYILLFILRCFSIPATDKNNNYMTTVTRRRRTMISRRSTNAPFILWSLAHYTTTVFVLWLVYYIVDTATAYTKTNTTKTKTPTPLVFHAVNRNGLILFVIANLLTGVVNLSMNTLDASVSEACGVMGVYLGVVAGLAVWLDQGLDATVKLG